MAFDDEQARMGVVSGVRSQPDASGCETEGSLDSYRSGRRNVLDRTGSRCRPFFGLQKAEADRMISDVAHVTETWSEIAKTVGARPSEIKRMESAFEHDDLYRALRL